MRMSAHAGVEHMDIGDDVKSLEKVKNRVSRVPKIPRAVIMRRLGRKDRELIRGL